jgi:hypothetical protein
MYVDVLGRVCNAQAFTAVAVSASSIDLGNVTPKREIAVGEAMGFMITVGVAASATTVLVEIIQATDDVLTAGIIVLAQRTFLSADMPLGAQIFFPIPRNPTVAGPLRFLGLRVTPAGGAATVTLSAFLTSHDLASVPPTHYADAITITG